MRGKDGPRHHQAVSTHVTRRSAIRPGDRRRRGYRCFNPRAHAARDPVWALGGPGSCRCFNPRAQAERDEAQGGAVAKHARVSIHAPTWSATFGNPTPRQLIGVFQSTHARTHAPTHPRTHGITHTPRRSFNPRAHAERDASMVYQRLECIVSTHAPTRSATRHARSEGPVASVSTHAPTRPRGARLCHRYLYEYRRLFQPTRPRGARPSERLAGSTKSPFQPTRPRGARRRHHQPFRALEIVSTHAPTQSATTSPSRR